MALERNVIWKDWRKNLVPCGGGVEPASFGLLRCTTFLVQGCFGDAGFLSCPHFARKHSSRTELLLRRSHICEAKVEFVVLGLRFKIFVTGVFSWAVCLINKT